VAEVLVLHHARKPELVNDEHLYYGRLELQNGEGALLQSDPFLGMPFHRMMTLVARELIRHPEAQVVMQRFDSPGLVPVQLGEQLRVLLRDDPAGAIRSMDIRGQFAPGPVVPIQGPVLRSGVDTLADAFGERVYLRMQGGCAEDPLTGYFTSLAYGPAHGWFVRGKSNSYQEWLPIRLEGAEIGVDDSAIATDPQAAVAKLGEVLPTLRWASCLVEDLLKLPGSRFYLPRRWNKQQWVSRGDLRERLDKFRKERQESC